MPSVFQSSSMVTNSFLFFEFVGRNEKQSLLLSLLTEFILVIINKYNKNRLCGLLSHSSYIVI